MTEYLAVWLVYDTKNHSKKVYGTIRDFVYDTKRGCNFLAKKAKKGCMTQKCMTQNVRPKMRAAFLALSFLHNSREDGGKKGSSHFDEKVSLCLDTTP